MSSWVGVNELSFGPSESVSQSQTAWSVQAEEQRTNQKQNEGTRMLSEATVVPSRWKRETRTRHQSHVTRRSTVTCVLRVTCFPLLSLSAESEPTLSRVKPCIRSILAHSEVPLVAYHRPQDDLLHFAWATFFVHAVDKTEVGVVEVSYYL